MPSVFDVEGKRLVEQRAAVVEEARGFREAAEHVGDSEGFGGVLDGIHVLQHAGAQGLELLELYPFRALVGTEDFVLHLLEFRGDIALAVSGRLLARVVPGHFGEVRLRDLDEVAEDGVELHLQTVDAGALDLARLQVGDPLFAFRAGAAEFVQFRQPAVAEQAAVLGSAGRLVHDGAGDQIRDLVEIAQPRREFTHQREAAAQRLQVCAHVRHFLQRLAEHLHVARIARLIQPAQRALDVADVLESLAAFGEDKRLRDERFDHILPCAERCQFAQRVEYPVAQAARAHRSVRAVQRMEQRVFLTAAVTDKIEIRAAGGVNDDALLIPRALHPPDVGHIPPQHLAQIVKHRARRAGRRLHAPAAESIQRLHFEMLQQQVMRLIVLKNPRLYHRRTLQRAELARLLIAVQQLRRLEPPYLIQQLRRVRELRQPALARRQVHTGESEQLRAAAIRRGKVIVPRALQHVEINHTARADDLRDFPLHQFTRYRV